MITSNSHVLALRITSHTTAQSGSNSSFLMICFHISNERLTLEMCSTSYVCFIKQKQWHYILVLAGVLVTKTSAQGKRAPVKRRSPAVGWKQRDRTQPEQQQTTTPTTHKNNSRQQHRHRTRTTAADNTDNTDNTKHKTPPPPPPPPPPTTNQQHSEGNHARRWTIASTNKRGGWHASSFSHQIRANAIMVLFLFRFSSTVVLTALK